MGAPEYWLATVERDQYGNGWNIKQHDGPHSGPEGVVQAKKIYDRIFKIDEEWVMVVVSDVPKVDVEINEEDADLLSEMVDRYRIRRGVPTSTEQEIAEAAYPGDEAFGSK